MAEDGLELQEKEITSLSGAEMLKGSYNTELRVALTHESDANRESRIKLQNLGINVRKAGYGLALSPLAQAGEFIGGVVGAGFGPIGALTGRFLGRAAGAESAGLVYDHVIRRFDKDLDPLTKRDYLVGAVIGNPVAVSGLVGIVEGMTTLRGDDVMKARLPTTFKQ